MISLKIQNLILIEKAEIVFGQGLNILTGETGSGKSAILSAIRLIAGERADASWIRKGSDLAIVEAVFPGDIYIRREIHRSGKNRCFIDEEQVSLSTLREKVNIEVIDQNSSQKLLEEQRAMLDAFAGTEEEVVALLKAISIEKEMAATLETLLQTPKERELEWAQKDLSWIEEINLQPGEEEKLSQEHTLLTHSQELAEKMQSVNYALSEENHLPTLKRVFPVLEGCARIDGKLSEAAALFKSALLELQETAHAVQSYTDRLEVNPERLETVEKRISDIEALKKRFGIDLVSHKTKLLNTIEHLLGLEDQIQTLKSSLETQKAKNQKAMDALTQKRKEAAPRFASLILKELKSLNIPHAQFQIAVADTFNSIEFFFSANPGVAPMPIASCASGGELSRVFLAIKTILSSGTSTLVFDEIDSNVGGQTATVIGEKLKTLSTKRQVICVTHFVQVAKQAMEHFLVSKKQKEGASHTEVKKLSEKERQTEYNRMLGTTL